MDRGKAHPRNVPGPFYVLDGCCTSCGVPESAPGSFGLEPDGHCYVKAQPEGAEQLERVLRVVRTQEFGCIRYGGDDLVVLRRLGEAGVAEQCDVALEPPAAPVHRDHVTFTLASGGASLAPRDMLARLRADLLDQLGSRARATDVEASEDGVRCSLAWFEDDFHPIALRARPGPPSTYHLHHGGPLSLSELLDDCLRARGYEAIRWSTAPAGDHEAPRPW